MTDRRIRCLTVFTIAFGMAILASHQAFPQSALKNKMRIKAANEKKKAEAAAKKAKAGERPKQEADAAASADSRSKDDEGLTEDQQPPVNQQDQPDKEIRPATQAQKASPQKKPRDWHVGDEPPTDDFRRGFTRRKRADEPNPDKPARAANDNGQPAAAGTYEYLKQQVLEIKRGQSPGGWSKPAVEQRQRAVDNLKALGPEAIDAVPALACSAVNERDAYVKRGAMEILGEFGGMLGVVALSATIFQPGDDAETAKAAEDALLKLLSAVGSSLTMNDAIFLLKVHGSRNERVSLAIESAWAASGITQDDIARELERRYPPSACGPPVQPIANAQGDARSNIQVLCLKILHPGNDPETAKAAEDALLKLLNAPYGGNIITPRDGFFLYDVRRLGNRHLLAAIKAAWEASGFCEYFALMEKYDREHPGQEEADAKAYAAAHGGKKKRHVRDLSESERYLMTPVRPGPDFGETLRSVNNFDARVAAERNLEAQGRRNNGIR